MGDSMDIEFLRDLVIVIAGAALVLWLIVMAIIAILLYRKVSAVLTLARSALASIQDGSKAIREALSLRARGGIMGAATGVLGQLVRKILAARKG